MNRLTLLIISFFFSFVSTAQYWQQEVNYIINVTLNDKDHTLSAFEEFEYINHSPNTLDVMYIHLWPNAYKNGKTALGKQQYEGGETELTFGPEEIKGWIDSLNFKADGQPVTWSLDPANIDIAILKLNTPLANGQRVKISTPFKVKIPSGSISRLGHIGQSYQITQWYPKPAVYDKNGWNAIPYLNQGEFYSEYGSFDVSITLPENYVVGATGDLQTQSEIDFLNAKHEDTKKNIKEMLQQKQGRGGRTEFPASSTTFKTIRYTQTKVHDFAWFADKRYAVSRSEVELPHSKRKVTTWAMWVPHNTFTWQYADEYLRDGTYYYSLWNGDYPYNQVTAVDGTISAGGGMEYPNVTVIGSSSTKEDLEVVIVHEVGHNWFYGILGSNERAHGWMDEGMNTLNEMRYIQTKYPDNQNMSDMVLNGRFHMNDLDHHDMGDISYRTIAHLGEDQPIETHSAEFSSANYGIIMYQKTGLVFYYLKDYLGEELFDKCMHSYFEEWKFKHPQPEDMRSVLEKTSGKDLSWLFEDLIQTTNHVDYKISSVKRSKTGTLVTVRNKGQVNGPIEVNLFKGDQIVETKWAEPGKNKRTLQFSTSDPDAARIDASKDIPEMYRNNNGWNKKGLFGKIEPIKMEFLIGDNEPDKTNLFWSPIIAANYYDKFMIGAVFHNNGIPFNRFQYLIAPMYSFGRGMASGIAELSYTTLPKTTFKTSQFGLSVKSFKDSDGYADKFNGAYAVLSPYWTAKLGQRKKAGPFSHSIRVQGILKYNVNNGLEMDYSGGFVKYSGDLNFPDHQFNYQLREDYIDGPTANMVRFTSEATYKFRYLKNSMKRWVEIRGFFGFSDVFASPGTASYPYAMSLSGTDGAQDLFYEDYYFGRGVLSGIWSQQRAENMGGFKSTAWYGSTADWMATSNIYCQLPIPKIGVFGVFCDFGVFSNGVSVNSAVNTGIGVRFGKVFGLYLPVWMSKELSDSFGNSRYSEKIRFTLKLNPFNGDLKIGNLL